MVSGGGAKDMNAFLRFTVCILIINLFGCRPDTRSTKLPQYHRQTRAQVIAALGAPASTTQFPMSEANSEFRIELRNTYPRSIPETLNVMIEELTWPDGDYSITLWLHLVDGQWVVLDSCRWHKDVRF